MLKINIKKIKYINRRWRYQVVYKVVLDIIVTWQYLTLFPFFTPIFL